MIAQIVEVFVVAAAGEKRRAAGSICRSLRIPSAQRAAAGVLLAGSSPGVNTRLSFLRTGDESRATDLQYHAAVDPTARTLFDDDRSSAERLRRGLYNARADRALGRRLLWHVHGASKKLDPGCGPVHRKDPTNYQGP